VPIRRPYLLPAIAAVLAGLVAAAPSSADLNQSLGNVRQHESNLQSSIGSDSRHIATFQGRINDLEGRLQSLETTLGTEQTQLAQTQASLRASRARLVGLQTRLARDRRALAAQLVARYESEPPDLVTVLFSSRGFADLLEKVDDLRRVSRQNTLITHHVVNTKNAVHTQTVRYAQLEAQQSQQTAAVLTQRDEVAQIKLAIVNRQAHFIRARSRKSARLQTLNAQARTLTHQLALAQARAAAAQAQAFGVSGVTPPKSIGSFVPHGGAYGFFEAPGTNYTAGVEPILAARLDALGKALHLHLIGLSGYRTPQHSVEVGGFADDPHTKGMASDTPGVEGVSESTLNQFGLTRPFGGAAEADHIQLLGSA
jgi:peptidoglycan hydrolase CwlO-like protein